MRRNKKLKRGFIRRVYKNIFAGMEDYNKAPYLRMKNKTLNYLLKESETKDIPNKTGYYFALLGQGIHGGIIGKNCKDIEDDLLVVPDLISYDSRYAWEYKSLLAGEPVKLEDIQVSKYVYLEKKLKEETGEFPVISYEIFKHRVTKSIKRFKEEPTEKLIKEISENVLNMVSLPLDIIIKINALKGEDKISPFIKTGKKGKFSSRYEMGRWYGDYTSLHSPALNGFIFRPEETLEVFGLNPDNYTIEKRKFQKGVKINGQDITPFPVLILRNKFYHEWIKEFMDKQGLEYLTMFEKTLSERTLLKRDLEKNMEEQEDWLKPLDGDVPF